MFRHTERDGTCPRYEHQLPSTGGMCLDDFIGPKFLNQGDLGGFLLPSPV
jgi:hypothetical protein